MSRINIAIDGPAGAGKSTVAKAVAQKLGIIYLDTGAMYRATALKVLRLGGDPGCEADVLPILSDTDIQIRYEQGGQRVYLDGEDVTGLIRTPEVSRGASDIGTIGAVRRKLVELQQSIARDNDVIMDGRDIGSCVLPASKHKFYVTASAAERARRRHAEMFLKDPENTPPVAQIQSEIEARDLTDSTRKESPLVCLPDAVKIDTTNMSIEEAVQAVLSNLQ